MNSNHSRISLPLPVLLVLVLLVALLGAVGGGATAAKLITGEQIKNNSVTGKDIKDGSLKVKEVRKSELRKLEGADGTDGDDGHSSFEPLPSGTTIRGGGILREYAHTDNVEIRSYVPLPFVASAILNIGPGGGQNVYSASSTAIAAAFENDTVCAGTYADPTVAPGKLCLYPVTGTIGIVETNSGILVPGVYTSNDGADKSGFYIEVQSGAAGEVVMHYVWAYTAP